LVLAADDHDVLLARLTTHPPRDSSDVTLQDWSAIGLPRSSTVRLSKLATVDARLVHHKIGHLHADDCKQSRKLGNNSPLPFPPDFAVDLPSLFHPSSLILSFCRCPHCRRRNARSEAECGTRRMRRDCVESGATKHSGLNLPGSLELPGKVR
jgi:hypothetical protein